MDSMEIEITVLSTRNPELTSTWARIVDAALRMDGYNSELVEEAKSPSEE